MNSISLWITPYGGTYVIPPEIMATAKVRKDGWFDMRATKANQSFIAWTEARNREDYEKLFNA